ncbi:MAG: hypothetical protein K6E91_09725 [Butyrivibrio sp.]|nr:hypothetical protein [Butyrivibrio sp.]
MLGKAKCKILKEIRQRIADENDIPYVTRECTYQGSCSGTCPKCESELQYLESELEKRRRLGKGVAVTALCTGIVIGTAACSGPGVFTQELGGAAETPPESWNYKDNDEADQPEELAGAAEEWPPEDVQDEEKDVIPKTSDEAFGGLKSFASTFNNKGVYNGPQACPLYTAEDDVVLKAVSTYHWNGGAGAAPGAIRIYDITDDESVLIGSWDATARDGSGAQNVLWDVFPDIQLQKGHKYHIKDSDPETWSTNEDADNMGFVELYTDSDAVVAGGGFKLIMSAINKLVNG